jgi:hypothetical protein
MSTALNLLIRVGLLVFVVVLGVNPRWRVSRFMFRSRGPRTDVVCLTRRQLFAEGTKALYLALFCFLSVWAGTSIGEAVGVDLMGGSIPGGVFVFVLSILMVIFAVAGIYMLIRGVFRSPGYVPPPHCGGRRVRTTDEIANDATRPISW